MNMTAMDKLAKELVRECVSSMLMEGVGRIQHAEDLVFWEGSDGATRAIKSLIDSSKGGEKNLTVKWDGSPAVVFGRDKNGQFVFTDKHGFAAKAYNGHAKSPSELENILLTRTATEKNDDFRKYARSMSNTFAVIEKSVPDNFRGYFQGDILYMSTPVISGDSFTFKPNVVRYDVPRNSDLGSRIEKSKVGLVVHSQLDVDGTMSSVKNMDIFKPGELLVVPPVTMTHPVPIDVNKFKSALTMVKSVGRSIDELLDKSELTKKQLTDFASILYTYLNSKVDTGLTDIGGDFFTWLAGNNRLTDRKKKNMVEHIKLHQDGFKNLWNVVSEVMSIKDEIISHLENSPSAAVKSSIGDYKGGEGYVKFHPKGNIKLVSRKEFSAANRAVIRKESLDPAIRH
jgi:hypothetical protein